MEDPKERSLLQRISALGLIIAISFVTIIIAYQINLQKVIWISGALLIGMAILFFLKKIDYFFWLFIFSLPFSKVAAIRIKDLWIQPSQALILLLVILWFLHETVKKDRSIKVPRTHLDLALVVFLMVNILSIYQSYNIPLNYADFAFPMTRNKPFLKSISQIILWIPGILSYYMTVTFLRKRESIVKAIQVWLFTMTAISLFGIYQFIGHYLKLPFADYYIQSFDFRYFGPLVIVRVGSVSLEPLFLAIYIMAFLPLAFVLLFGRINLINRRYLVMIILASSLCLAFTFSIANIFMILSILILGTYVLRNFKPYLSRKILIASFITVLAVVIPIHNVLSQKLKFILNTNDYSRHISAFQRVVCWKTAFNMFLRHPLLGVGIGNFSFNFLGNIPDPKIVELMTHTGMPRIINNIYIEILSETGIFGFFAFMYILYSLLKRPMLRMRHMKDRYWDTILLGLIFCFTAVLAGHLFVSAFYYPYVWVLMGLITATERVTHDA